MFGEFEVRTPSHACLVEVTSQVQASLTKSNVSEGVCHVFVPHTTAGVTINENADPTVRSDMLKELEKIVPWNDGYAHGEGNAAAHIKASLIGSSTTVAVSGGRLRLGTWQGIYLAEFDGPRTRKVWVSLMSSGPA